MLHIWRLPEESINKRRSHCGYTVRGATSCIHTKSDAETNMFPIYFHWVPVFLQFLLLQFGRLVIHFPPCSWRPKNRLLQQQTLWPAPLLGCHCPRWLQNANTANYATHRVTQWSHVINITGSSVWRQVECSLLCCIGVRSPRRGMWCGLRWPKKAEPGPTSGVGQVCCKSQVSGHLG